MVAVGVTCAALVAVAVSVGTGWLVVAVGVAPLTGVAVDSLVAVGWNVAVGELVGGLTTGVGVAVAPLPLSVVGVGVAVSPVPSSGVAVGVAVAWLSPITLTMPVTCVSPVASYINKPEVLKSCA